MPKFNGSSPKSKNPKSFYLAMPQLLTFTDAEMLMKTQIWKL